MQQPLMNLYTQTFEINFSDPLSKYSKENSIMMFESVAVERHCNRISNSQIAKLHTVKTSGD